MNRFLCVWLRNWPVHRLVVEQPELSNKPVVLHNRDSRQRQLVVACSSKAESMGVRINMPLTDATTLVTGKQFHIQQHDARADEQALTALADWCHQFSSVVAIDLPDSLCFDLEGITHLHGNEIKLAKHVIQEFYSKGYRPRVAIADTPGAAWAAVHFSNATSTIVPAEKPETLFQLPVAALRIPTAALEKLDRLGVHHIAQLVDLPRKNLPSRIGKEVLERLDYLTGNKTEAICGHKPPPTFEQQWLLDQATDHLETIQHIVKVLMERLANQLRCHGRGALRLEIGFNGRASRSDRHEHTGLREQVDNAKQMGGSLVCESRPNKEWRCSIGLFRPGADACHLNSLAQMQLETAKIPAAVEYVTVVANETEPLRQQQHSLLDAENVVSSREVADLIERLGIRLGANRVVKAVPIDDWQAEKAFCYQPLTQRTERPCQSIHSKQQKECFAVRPLRMFFPPLPLEVVTKTSDGPPVCFQYHGEQKIINFWGPERLESAWWRGVCVKRDYYRVETESASRFWLFRRLDDNQWFLHGSFD